jgi:hypothetical protein
MKTLFKLALAGLLTAVLVKWVRQWQDIDRLSPDGQAGSWEPDAAEPLRGENLQVEPPGIH